MFFLQVLMLMGRLFASGWLWSCLRRYLGLGAEKVTVTLVVLLDA
jgi:hypothetical protein